MQRANRIKSSAVGVAIAAAAMCGSARAAIVDLIAFSSGSANGTVYLRNDAQSTGTGAIEPFLRVQRNGTANSEQGYNADYGPKSGVPFDEKVGTWTHSMQFSDLHSTDIGGVAYYEFMLDLDESNAASKLPVSLDSVQIFNTGATALSAPFSDDLSTLGAMLYDMDAGADGDSSVLMDGSRTHGNGQSDMAMYILADAFAGVGADDFITFYSLFSNVDGSFEEWAVRESASEVPLPGTLGLLGIGLLGLGIIRRREHS